MVYAYSIGLTSLLKKYYPNSVINSIEPENIPLNVYYEDLASSKDCWKLFESWVDTIRERGEKLWNIEQDHKKYLEFGFRAVNKIHKTTHKRNDIFSPPENIE